MLSLLKRLSTGSHLRLIRLIGVIVPRRLRADWQQEWEAELHYREALLAEWDRLNWRSKLGLLRRSTSAFWDALCLQPRRLEDEMFQDLRFGLRILFKQKGFTVTALLTLALGIAANTSIFSLINGVLLKPLPYSEPERLVSVFENFKERSQDFVDLNAPGFIDWRSQNTVFEEMAAYQGRGFDLTGIGEATRVFGVRASASLFPLLRINPALGRGFSAEEDVFGGNRVAVIGHQMWQERFGGMQEVLGKALTLDGHSYSVIGVMPAGFQFAGINPDVWVPMAFEPWELNSRGSHNYQGIARLKPNVSQAQAQAEMNAIAMRLGGQFEHAKGWGITLVSLQEQLVGSSRKPLLVLFGAVGLVLLIACANVANLLLARAAAREREFAIRAALGAGRGRIVRQLLLESSILAVGGALLGWGLSYLAVAAVTKFGAATFPRLEEVRLDGRALGFTVALSLITGLIFGLAPAWLATQTKLNETLKDAARGSTQNRRQRLRAGFVVAQVALAVMLLIGASLLLRSFIRLQGVDLGFQSDHILTASLTMPDARFPGRDAQRMTFLSRMVDRISTLPDVESAASVMGLPVAFGGASSAFYFDGQPAPEPSAMQVAGYSQISANYFETMKTPMARGRQFEARDTVTAPYVAIVNEAFVRTFLNGQEPLGKGLWVMDSQRKKPTKIVGVVRDMRQRDITMPAKPEMYFPATQRCWADAQLVIRTHGNPTALIAALRRAALEIDPAQTIYLIRTLAELTDNAVAQRRLQMILLLVFAGLALLLSAIGIYGVMTFSVAQRTQEIGVRMSLGAQRGHVLSLILRQGMILALAGVTIGIAGAFALTRLMGSLLYEISPTDPLTFASIPFLLLAVACFASWLPAQRASRLDPLKALRHE